MFWGCRYVAASQQLTGLVQPHARGEHGLAVVPMLRCLTLHGRYDTEQCLASTTSAHRVARGDESVTEQRGLDATISNLPAPGKPYSAGSTRNPAGAGAATNKAAGVSATVASAAASLPYSRPIARSWLVKNGANSAASRCQWRAYSRT